jgi:trichohyalin
MNIINGNKVHVVIGVIKDEKILDYPLGESDYNIEGENLETRIDIYYMNTRFKNLDKDAMQSIYTKYSKIYKSITFLSNPIQNFDNLLKKYKEMELKIIKMEKEKKEYEDMKRKGYEDMKRKEYEDMKLKMEKEKKEYEDMKLKMEKEKKEYEDMKLKMEKEKKEYEDMKLKMENERKDKDAKTEESENQPEHGKNYKVKKEKNGDN